MAGVPANLAIFGDSLKNVLIWDKTADAHSYKLYWGLTSPLTVFPVEQFTSNYDNWSTEIASNATAEISSNKLLLTISAGTGEILLKYRYPIPAGDFTMTVDISDYTQSAGAGDFRAALYLTSADDKDQIQIHYYRTLTLRYLSNFVVNSASSAYTNTAPDIPTKLKLERVGTNAKTHVYDGASWTNLRTFAFGARISNILYVELRLKSTVARTGYVKFDNVTIDPAGNANEISVDDYVYEHTGLTAGTTYYYMVASVQDSFESLPCSEVSSVPLAEQEGYVQLTTTDRATILNLRVNDFQESDEDYDFYIRSQNATMKAYNLGKKKRFVLLFKNINSSDVTTLKTLYDARETLFFHRDRTGATLIRVKFKGSFNFHTPTNKSKAFLSSIYEGSIILEEVGAA